MIRGRTIGLEVGDRIQIGGGIYQLTRIADINTAPKLEFHFDRLAEEEIETIHIEMHEAETLTDWQFSAPFELYKVEPDGSKRRVSLHLDMVKSDRTSIGEE